MAPSNPKDNLPNPLADNRRPDDRAADSVSKSSAQMIHSSMSPYSHSAPIPNRLIPAWVLSLLLHTSIFVLLILLMSRFQNGGAEVVNRTGGIVLVKMNAESTEYLSEGEVEQAADAQTAAASDQAAPNLDLPPELPGMTTSTNAQLGAAESIANGLTGVGDLNLNQPKGRIGGQVTTSVFGVTGTGSRFVYVLDRSESMRGFDSLPILSARKQLVESLDSLDETHQFQIIIYNQDVKIFNRDGRPTMYFADEKNREAAKRFINRTHPDGGTDHLNALRLAFQMNPDVIFLLTDAEGGFTQAEINLIANLNRSAAVINTIEFGERKGLDRSLEAVSKTSGGQYLFKNINTLRVEDE